VTNPPRPARLAATALAAAILLGAIGAGAQIAPRIVNGLDTQDFATTGAVLYSNNVGLPVTADNAVSWCSGILIGCHTFLTAAHCVGNDTVASHYQVYLQNGGIHAVSSVTFHPEYTTNLWSRDVAVLKLTQPVEGINPTPVNSTHDLLALGVGFSGTIVGFGRTGGSSDYGIKRHGGIVTSNCKPASTGGFGDEVLVCWDYDTQVGPPGTDSNSCNGDSGGPLLMTFSGATEVVGVTSAGVNATCGVGDHSWDASIYYHSAWILQQLGDDSTEACADLAPVGDPATTVQKNTGTLDAITTLTSFDVEVPAATERVVFTLNGINNGFNPDFYVKQGSGAGPGGYDCKSDGLSVFGACSFENPAAGTWSVFVQRLAGGGQFQITTTMFGATPTACGDGALNGGITASDALSTLKTAVGTLSRSRCVCDVNNSGSVTASDALMVLRVAVGETIAFSCPKCG